jgi:predicted  nucleic acid-binding Zn-ribbon protein
MADLTETLQTLARCEQDLEERGRRAHELPGEIATVEQQAAAARAIVEDEREALAELDHKRREQEAALQDAEELRNRYRGQTASVKTNEEYHALLREIDDVTTKISNLEEEILAAMEEIERRGGNFGTLEREQAEIEQGLAKRGEVLQQEFQTTREEIATLEAERETILGKLAPDIQTHYRRVQSGKGRGTSRLEGRICVACYRDVPFETVNRIMAGELHTCSSCNRILVAEAG